MQCKKCSIKICDIVIAKEALVAKSFFSRLLGLMFKEEMKDHDALLIENCNSIHTCFMRFAIDVAFISKDFKVIKVKRNIKPWRFTRMYFSAAHVLEMESGKMPVEMQEGSSLDVECIS